ncbi:MAG: rhodanese-like domain-containing protein [Deinococcus sp.]|nr:rhodanese-like domain-containing protein [Deinococcus sp.]MCL5964385.1 rhodanese-like domain-containing protein [Deinococcus sp.]
MKGLKGWVLAVAGAVVVLAGVFVLQAPAQAYKNVNVSELYAAGASGALVLDVRQPEEYAQGHVKGAKLIPLGEIEARAAEVPDSVPVYVICHSGNRSAQASKILAAKGKRDIRNVEGGILAWQAAGYPVER